MIIKCTRCGGQVETEEENQVRFCPRCGADIRSQTARKKRTIEEILREEAEAKRAERLREQEKAEEEKRDKKILRILIMSLVAIMLLCVFLGIFRGVSAALRAIRILKFLGL
ncbi:MAG: hypothetical protein E7435_05435 [Ruminococcaceae bacterium]|nr:hypothetical protein [Oscillospiraceae bacterium]